MQKPITVAKLSGLGNKGDTFRASVINSVLLQLKKPDFLSHLDGVLVGKWQSQFNPNLPFLGVVPLFWITNMK